MKKDTFERPASQFLFKHKTHLKCWKKQIQNKREWLLEMEAYYWSLRFKILLSTSFRYVRIIEFITTAAVRNPSSCRSPKVYQTHSSTELAPNSQYSYFGRRGKYDLSPKKRGANSDCLGFRPSRSEHYSKNHLPWAIFATRTIPFFVSFGVGKKTTTFGFLSSGCLQGFWKKNWASYLSQGMLFLLLIFKFLKELETTLSAGVESRCRFKTRNLNKKM